MAADRRTSADSRNQRQTTSGPQLKDPALAAFLAWLVPGLGHFYQGRRAKGALFSICVLVTFFHGLYLGGGKVVYAAWTPEHKRLQYLCQVGVGLPALPAMVQTYRVRSGKQPLFSPDFMTPPQMIVPPRYDDRIHTWDLDEAQRRLARFFELGTVYTVIAGLLNILVIYDAWGGPAYGDDDEEPPDEAPPGDEKRQPARAAR